MLRRAQFRELFLALRRGTTIGPCATCETFYLMAKLCLQEGAQWFSPEEVRDLESWIVTGEVLEVGSGCDDACAIIPLYARISR